ncbi:ATP-binding cassette domain-containing protein [Roseibium aggregatum]|uniref:ATP-binding cassette domain-containing protein n=1 Tax=Roseibium aggregatum TaxID=187304 RepID=UPI0025AC3D7E|nr:ATP-binding cassette domain-containing protein [Roseibium aggregatum]WJS05530.1 ATP-binding cassette domain-containing protein [Roseibium aggregatum]
MSVTKILQTLAPHVWLHLSVFSFTHITASFFKYMIPVLLASYVKKIPQNETTIFDLNELAPVGLAVLFIFLSQAVFFRIANICTVSIENKCRLVIQTNFINKFLTRRRDCFPVHASLSNILQDFEGNIISIISILLWHVFDIIIISIVVATVLFFYSPVFSLIIVVWIFLEIVFNLFFLRPLIAKSRRLTRALISRISLLNDLIVNREAVLSSDYVHFEKNLYRKKIETENKIRKNIEIYRVAGKSIKAFVYVFVLIGFVFSALTLSKSGGISLPDYIVLFTTIFSLFDKLWSLSQNMTELQSRWSYLTGTINQLEAAGLTSEIVADQKNDDSSTNFGMGNIIAAPNLLRPVIDEVEAQSSKTRVEDEAMPTQLAARVELINLSFRYPGSKHHLFVGLNEVFAPGSVNAIVGSSGSGKSTLGRLIKGSLPPSSGSLHLNGIDTQKLNSMQLNQLIYYLPQDSSLFERSGYANLYYGLQVGPNGMLQRSAALKAARNLGISNVVEFAQSVSNNRTKIEIDQLSAGEKSRLLLSRAAGYVGQRGVMLLDEPDAGLDEHNVAVLASVISEFRNRVTTIVISHRMHKFVKFDNVLSLG